MSKRAPEEFEAVVLVGDADDAAAFMARDRAIRSGRCPNGCAGEMAETVFGQECGECGFFCNTARDE